MTKKTSKPTPKAAPSNSTPGAHRLKGVLSVFQTPYKTDESIDFKTLEKHVDFIFDTGAHGVVMAMVSETLRLTSEEREELAKNVTKMATKRGAVIISTGAESIPAAVRYSKQAEKIGADAVMVIPPVSVGVGESELLRYYRAIIEAIRIPVIVQDASGYVGKPMPIKMQAQLLDEYGPERVQYKPEATPIGPKLSELRDATKGKARVFEGTGGIALIDSYKRGIVGTMPGGDLLKAIVPLWNALEAKDHNRAYQIWEPLTGLLTLQSSLDSYLAIEKYLLVKQGVFKNTIVRGPVAYKIDEETRLEIDVLFDRILAAVAAK
jgi:dihydrodipicolinate synthase/N-acetylneuraminate lyase